MQDLQDLVQDLASLARKILARFGYFLQDRFYWDEAYMQLKETIMKGFPDHKNQLPEALRKYWQVCRELSIEDDLILYG